MRRRSWVSGVLGYGLGRSLGGMGLGSGALGWHGFTPLALAQNLPTPLMQHIRISAASDLKFALADVLNQFQRDTAHLASLRDKLRRAYPRTYSCQPTKPW